MPARSRAANLAGVLGFLRTAISLLFLSLLVYCSFTVPLGPRTLAEHVDRIGETREARELIRGARGRINPVLEEAKGRLLGEYVEAPTYAPASAKDPKDRRAARRRPRSASLPAGSRSDGDGVRRPSTPSASRLPGAYIPERGSRRDEEQSPD